MTDTPEVTILLGIYNGAPWLAEQLDSFAAQEGMRWRLIASDDGSADASAEIFGAFARNHPGACQLEQGPGHGPAQNFLHLLRSAPENSEYVALSDQDDVWLPRKLSQAVASLAHHPADRPALYAGRTIICDEALNRTGLSPLFQRPPSFRNALVQSIGGGNTMVLNRAAAELVRAAAGEVDEIVMHDWWLYQLISGVGGTVIYDSEPMLLYRQHGGNQVGSNASLLARLHRARMVAGGRLKRWNAINVEALQASSHRLTPDNRDVLARFAEARTAPLRRRVQLLRALKLYRQTRGGDVSYWAAALAGQI